MSSTARDAAHLDPLTGTPKAKAAHVVEDVAAGWDHRTGDLGRLLDAASAALADRANHELRQVLAQLSTELELLRLTLDTDATTDERLDRMLDAIDRGSDVVGTHLDRNEVAKLLIQIHPEPVALDSTIRDCLARAGIPEDTVDLDLHPTVVTGDGPKLATVVEYLLERFHRAAAPEDMLTVRVTTDGDRAEGVIGLTPASEAGEALIGELETPLDIEAYGVDLPYSRAVVERHGGSLFVEQLGEDGLGFGFHLPIAATGNGGGA